MEIWIPRFHCRSDLHSISIVVEAGPQMGGAITTPELGAETTRPSKAADPR